MSLFSRSSHIVSLFKVESYRESFFQVESYRESFSRPSHTSDLEIGTPLAILPSAWRYRVSAGTGWPGVSIL